MEKRWLVKAPVPEEKVRALSSAINVNPYLATVLVQRGIETLDAAREYFRPSLNNLHDPFLMRDMSRAVERLHHAICNQEKILIYGDYDVDGTTSVALAYLYLTSFYPHIDVYVPDRYSEGYGVSEQGIRWAAEHGISLIIALDCGIKATAMVELAAQNAIDFIICDHHLPGDELPPAVAILDPKRKDCEYPFKELSGCGIGFKFMHAYAQTYGNAADVLEYLDLVCVSIASDIVAITDENRILAFHGLEKLNRNPIPGLKALKEFSALRGDLDISGVVFSLGPRINAAGRVAHARAAVELLIASSEHEALALAERVNLKNEFRRQVDMDITEEAIAMIEGDPLLKQSKSTVLFKNTWHKGIIGIVAARCVEKFYRPTIILTESNNKITGSGRSVMGFDLYTAIEECSDLLEKFGGHRYAAGLTLDSSNLAAFQRKFEEVVSASITEEMLVPVIEIELALPFDIISAKFLGILNQMAPFGPENPKPVFVSHGVYAFNSLSSFKDRHLRFLAAQHGSESVFSAVGFDMITHYDGLAKREPFSMAYTLEENTYNGTTSIQMRIRDIKF